MRLIDADRLKNSGKYVIMPSGAVDVVTFEDIDNAPTIGGWIPVGERLPKEHTMVLACWHDIRRGREDQYSIIPSWVEHGQWRSSAGFIYRKVTAWMPLPEPYSIESDGIGGGE